MFKKGMSKNIGMDLNVAPSGTKQSWTMIRDTFKRGRSTKEEDAFITANINAMTNRQMADSLKRKTHFVANRIKVLELRRESTISEKLSKPSSFLHTMNDKEKAKYFRTEVTLSATFRALKKSFTDAEQQYYIDKYANFMLDPSIETMTAMEKDALHELIVNQVRINRWMQEEKEDKELVVKQKLNRQSISRSREIKEAQELIAKYQKSLNVEREQRLKNQSDQSVTFNNIIRDLKSQKSRIQAGQEAAMLKYIAERSYNHALGTNIISGKDKTFDIGKLFHDGKAPDLSADFIPKGSGVS